MFKQRPTCHLWNLDGHSTNHPGTTLMLNNKTV